MTPVRIDGDGWVRCPCCGGKSRTKVRWDTLLKNFPLFCPKCGRETLIDFGPHPEPDAQTQSQ